MTYATEAERLEARRATARRYYWSHLEVCKLKQLKFRTTEGARRRALEGYPRRMDAKAAAAGVPRRGMGRPRLTDEQVQAQMATYAQAAKNGRVNGDVQKVDGGIEKVNG